jgi:molybdenum cofactor biosynthesis enzyme MoaA
MGGDRERTELILESIEDELSEGLEHIECTGSGDPFFSKTFLKWFITFKPYMYPNLKSIHLHTNGTLWNESNWGKMKDVQKYIKSAEISVDAATKETYEKVRLGGKWDDIQKNLKFISTLTNLDYITMSFVVQKENYKEMEMFYKMSEDIFGNTTIRWRIFFNRILNWERFDSETFKKIDVGNPNHPEYKDMVEIYHKIPKSNNISHNLTIND